MNIGELNKRKAKLRKTERPENITIEPPYTMYDCSLKGGMNTMISSLKQLMLYAYEILIGSE
uniref:Uncharacterized protein n=1 Tax=Setaria digitata TaxID=48799 RepID=A0A915PKY9_9BILA